MRLRMSVVGYASAGFAEALKMPRAEARGASLSKHNIAIVSNGGFAGVVGVGHDGDT